MEPTVDDIIHYGVPGMRWGKRKAARAALASDDATRTSDFKKRAKKGGTAALSTKELQDLVTRMNLEKQYSTLNQKPDRLKSGTKMAKSILDVGGTVNQAINFGKSPGGKLLGDLLASQFKKKTGIQQLSIGR